MLIRSQCTKDIAITAIHSQCVVPVDSNIDTNGRYRRSTLYSGRVLVNYAKFLDIGDKHMKPLN